MVDLNPEKLNVVFQNSVEIDKLTIPRKYTLTHSDRTGDLFLNISNEYNYNQISGLYTRFMRDEVLAEWKEHNKHYELHIYLHVSGGFVFGWASMRNRIFRFHLPLVIEALIYAERVLFEICPSLIESPILVHFNSKNQKYNKIEHFGLIKDFEIKV